jgi:hypothetical protein
MFNACQIYCKKIDILFTLRENLGQFLPGSGSAIVLKGWSWIRIRIWSMRLRNTGCRYIIEIHRRNRITAAIRKADLVTFFRDITWERKAFWDTLLGTWLPLNVKSFGTIRMKPVRKFANFFAFWLKMHFHSTCCKLLQIGNNRFLHCNWSIY